MAIGLEHIKAAQAAAKERTLSGLNDLITVIFADKGIGKSTMASRFERPFFLDCEDRLRTVVMPDGTAPSSKVIQNWNELKDWTKTFHDTTPDESGVKTVVVDGLGSGFKMLRESILTKFKVQHENEGELGYGKGKGIIIRELESWFNDLRTLTQRGYGVVITAHERTVEFSNNGVEFDRKVPLVSGDKSEYGWMAIKAFPDIVVHGYKTRGKQGPEHRMHLIGTELFEATFSKPGVDSSKVADLPFSYAELERAWLEA